MQGGAWQPPAQQTSPLPHAAPPSPAHSQVSTLHVSPITHVVPQPPQLLTSDADVSTQPSVPQHSSEPVHMFPQPLQCARLVSVFTQPPPQHVSAAPMQVIPQEPQFIASVSRSTQPLSQQNGSPPLLQLLPHMPQLSMSLVVSVQPSPGQHMSPPVQAAPPSQPHMPIVQVSGAVHDVVQFPQ